MFHYWSFIFMLSVYVLSFRLWALNPHHYHVHFWQQVFPKSAGSLYLGWAKLTVWKYFRLNSRVRHRRSWFWFLFLAEFELRKANTQHAWCLRDRNTITICKEEVRTPSEHLTWMISLASQEPLSLLSNFFSGLNSCSHFWTLKRWEQRI